jgi:hypothetical protein
MDGLDRSRFLWTGNDGTEQNSISACIAARLDLRIYLFFTLLFFPHPNYF